MPKPKPNAVPQHATNGGTDMTITSPETELARALAAAREGVDAASKVVTDLTARIQAADAAVETSIDAHRVLLVRLGSGSVVADAELTQAQAGISAAKDRAAALRQARGTANTALVAANRELHIATVNNARRHLAPAVQREAALREELAVVQAWIADMTRAMHINEASVIEVAAAKRPECLIVLDGVSAAGRVQSAA